jgi:penicillin amidase
MLRPTRRLRRAAAIVLSVPILAAALAVMVLRATVTRPSGSIAIAGLSGPVEIVRDREGVPHVFGGSLEDLSAALGFAHAQDRLWQMELMRRAGQGRLSELFGEPTLDTDIFLRTLDLDGHAERSLASLPAGAREMLEAYARGVNAFIGRDTRSLEPRYPPEFILLRHAPEPWRPADSILAVKMMALSLATNLRHEIKRLALAAQGLSPGEIDDLMPTEDAGAGPALPDLATLYPLRRVAVLDPPPRLALLEPPGGGGASNNWVVSGARTASGMPLLANDPHLRLSAPSVWCLAHLALEQPGAEAVNIVGASLPGTPVIVLGRGNSLAWGFTTTGADVQDLFIEKLRPGHPDEYLTPDGWRRFDTSEMTFRVRGGEPRTVLRRSTRHGPVLPPSYGNLGRLIGEGHVAALQWTALSDDDTTIAAGLFDPKVRTVEQFMEKMRAYVVPMQSMVVADTRGRIGLIAPGRVPVRDPANRIAGRAPVPGWAAAYDWKGYLPHDQLPRVVDPPAGAIGTSNTRIVDAANANLLTYDWEPAFRQQRIRELVLERSGHDIATMRAAQTDVRSTAFARLLPLMLESARAGGSTEAEVLGRLAAWDATMRADTAEPLIFMAWVRETVRALFQNRLGSVFPQFFDTRAPTLIRLLEGRAAGVWCGTAAGSSTQACGRVLAGALSAALADLERRYGADRARWTWGEAHVAHNEHRAFGHSAKLGPIFNVEVTSPGGPYTLNLGKTELDTDRPYFNRHGPSYRAIYDLADLDRSLYIQSTGQSGNPFSSHYRSFAERWAKGEYITIPTRRSAIHLVAVGTWRLTPR